MASVQEIRKAQRAEGPATILAIGTATPTNCVNQADYPDYYFRITNSDHMTELKDKFKRMCMLSSLCILVFPLNILLFIYLFLYKIYLLHLNVSLYV